MRPDADDSGTLIRRINTIEVVNYVDDVVPEKLYVPTLWPIIFSTA